MAKKQNDQDRVIMARIEGQPANAGNIGPDLMLVLGCLVIVLAILFEDSAIRLAAWGAIWTGWNILWGIAF